MLSSLKNNVEQTNLTPPPFSLFLNTSLSFELLSILAHIWAYPKHMYASKEIKWLNSLCTSSVEDSAFLLYTHSNNCVNVIWVSLQTWSFFFTFLSPSTCILFEHAHTHTTRAPRTYVYTHSYTSVIRLSSTRISVSDLKKNNWLFLPSIHFLRNISSVLVCYQWRVQCLRWE